RKWRYSIHRVDLRWYEVRYPLLFGGLLEHDLDGHIAADVLLGDPLEPGHHPYTLFELDEGDVVGQLVLELLEVALVHDDPRPDLTPAGHGLPFIVPRQAVRAVRRRREPDV